MLLPGQSEGVECESITQHGEMYRANEDLNFGSSTSQWLHLTSVNDRDDSRSQINLPKASLTNSAQPIQSPWMSPTLPYEEDSASISLSYCFYIL
jgi:hypothetical protein